MYEKILIKLTRIFLWMVLPFITLAVAGFVIVVALAYFISFVDYLGQPSSSKYKKKLEYMTQVELPSCRVVKKTYAYKEYYGAILKLNQKDFNKALEAIQTDTSFRCVPDAEYWHSTLKMLQNKNIDTALVNYKYINSFETDMLYFIKEKKIIIIDGIYL